MKTRLRHRHVHAQCVVGGRRHMRAEELRTPQVVSLEREESEGDLASLLVRFLHTNIKISLTCQVNGRHIPRLAMDSSLKAAERRVVAFAAATRALVTLLALLTTRLATPYDTSARLAPGGGGGGAAFVNWDGVFFAQIATRGYEYEHVHAFFPLYPLLMRALRCVRRLPVVSLSRGNGALTRL